MAEGEEAEEDDDDDVETAAAIDAAAAAIKIPLRILPCTTIIKYY
jgi:hypothetical protein